MKRLSPIAVAVSFVLALAQFRLIVLVFGTQYGKTVEAARGVVLGKPHWRIYQSRVLGPWLSELFSKVLPSFIAGHVAVTILALTAAGLIAWRIGEVTRTRLVPILTTHALFAALLAKPWLYVWDVLDVVAFLLFALFVLEKRPWKHFAALAGMAMLNHEIAGFIAAWLVLDPIFEWLARGREGRPRSAPIAAGLATLAAGMVIVELLRGALLVEEIGPKLMPDAPKDIGTSLYFALPRNVKVLAEIFTFWDWSFPQLVLVLVVGCLAGAFLLAKADLARWGAFAATHAALIVALVVFGTLLETRIYVVLIPLVVVFAARFTAPDRLEARDASSESPTAG